MARKNPFATVLADEGGGSQPSKDYAAKGASRSFLSSLDDIASRAERLAEGEAIVELDPGSVDESFVKDRIETDDVEFADLLSAIESRGQDSPILVRPHPSHRDRYMVVFGHRRLRVAKTLGRPVRAIVKAMDDREHVLAQGQENGARQNLTFIERARYAARLTKLRYDEDNSVVLAALSIDKATLSKMLSVAQLPAEILDWLGRARGIGRDRWYELKQLLEPPDAMTAARDVVLDAGQLSLASEQRFDALVDGLRAARRRKARGGIQKRNWAAHDGLVKAEMSGGSRSFTLALRAKGKDAYAFGEYLSEQLPRMYEAFRKGPTSSNGDPSA